MQFLKTLLWIAVAVVVALFAMRNSVQVEVNLWSDVQVLTPLWVIVVIAFLVGLLPVLALYRTSRWRWRRRFEQAERDLAEARGQVAAATIIAPAVPVATQPGLPAEPETDTPAEMPANIPMGPSFGPPPSTGS